MPCLHMYLKVGTHHYLSQGKWKAISAMACSDVSHGTYHAHKFYGMGNKVIWNLHIFVSLGISLQFLHSISALKTGL